LAEAVRSRAPRLVLVPSTARGRDLAPRVAARLGLGLTGDAIDLDLDAEGGVRQMKPAFSGAIVAPILSHTRPEMATVRPGILRPARPDATRRAAVERLAVPAVPGRVRVVSERSRGDATGAALEAADIVLGVGHGVGGPAALPAVTAVAARLGAAVAATRDVTDAGWLPKQHQVGLTGRAIAPRLYVAIALSGAPEHGGGDAAAPLAALRISGGRGWAVEAAERDLVDGHAEAARVLHLEEPAALGDNGEHAGHLEVHDAVTDPDGGLAAHGGGSLPLDAWDCKATLRRRRRARTMRACSWRRGASPPSRPSWRVSTAATS